MHRYFKNNKKYYTSARVLVCKNTDFIKRNLLIENLANFINGADSFELGTGNFTSEFLSYVRKCIPKQTITVRPREP